MSATAYVQRALVQGWSLARIEWLCDLAAAAVVQERRQKARMRDMVICPPWRRDASRLMPFSDVQAALLARSDI